MRCETSEIGCCYNWIWQQKQFLVCVCVCVFFFFFFLKLLHLIRDWAIYGNINSPTICLGGEQAHLRVTCACAEERDSVGEAIRREFAGVRLRWLTRLQATKFHTKSYISASVSETQYWLLHFNLCSRTLWFVFYYVARKTHSIQPKLTTLSTNDFRY